MSPDELVIDGSQGEGGGQILRTSIALAAALHAAGGPGQLRIVNIRSRRPKPGLAAQHLAAVKAAAAVCGGQLEGAGIGARELTFRPGAVRTGQYRFEIGTAGSAMLVLQTVLPALLTATGDSEVVITGGTHNPFAPCFEYARDVFATLAEAAGASFALVLERAGFYPAGGGVVRCRIRGAGGGENIAPLRMLSRGELRRVEALSAATESLPEHIVRRQGRRVEARLAGAPLPGSVEYARWPTACAGTVVFLRAVFSRSVAGFFALGRRGKSAEAVADEAVDELAEFLSADGAVDCHAADQLIALLALSPQKSQLTTAAVTAHLITNAQVIRQLTGRAISIQGQVGSPGVVTVEEG